MLEELPDTLDETYERILRDINKANRDHAHRLLQCLTVAVRPLRVAELAEVLAVDFGSGFRGGSRLNTDWRWEDQQEAVLSTCSSLISVVDQYGGQVVQFSHFSVKEFLTSSRIGGSSADVSRFYILLEPAHTIVAKACLGVLMGLGELVDEDNVEDRFPLAEYAAVHWVEHARFENVSSQIREAMEDLFDRDKPCFAAWLRTHDIDTVLPGESALHWFVDFTTKGSNTANPLYYAAVCGFFDIAEQLIIEYPQQVSTTGGYYVSPLGAALSRGYLTMAQLLYDCGADVDVQGRNNRTPLYSASSSGHPEIVRWLLSRGANPTVCEEGFGWTPLHAATDVENEEISGLLLQHKVDIDARDHEGSTPLHVAVQYGRVNVARFLLEQGADVNAGNNEGSTPLHYASMYGHLEIARLLVEDGAKIDAVDDEGRTALLVASETERHDLVKFLSDCCTSK